MCSSVARSSAAQPDPGLWRCALRHGRSRRRRGCQSQSSSGARKLVATPGMCSSTWRRSVIEQRQGFVVAAGGERSAMALRVNTTAAQSTAAAQQYSGATVPIVASTTLPCCRRNQHSGAQHERCSSAKCCCAAAAEWCSSIDCSFSELPLLQATTSTLAPPGCAAAWRPTWGLQQRRVLPHCSSRVAQQCRLLLRRTVLAPGNLGYPGSAGVCCTAPPNLCATAAQHAAASTAEMYSLTHDSLNDLVCWAQ